MRAPPLRAVLLDMGGVLLAMANEAGLPRGADDREGRERLLALLRARGGRAAAADLERLLFAPWRLEYERRYERQREADWRPHLDRLLASSGARATGDELLAAWFGPYGARLQATPGAASVVAELRRRGLPLALVSNVALPGALYRERLAAHGLLDAFAVTRFSYDAGSRKPSPAMLAEAMAALGVPASAAVMVGDRRSSDVAAGRAAGTSTIWLRSHHDEGPAADLTIDALTELPTALERLGAVDAAAGRRP
ncbi:MAG TPA: HAD family hydrolase [Thermoanaerobaculia bacterium]|jgi:HAD superfamily hydrolase (TIGR01509 family)|nr:HAD family hydrolase [Thermoanaerobaculia bacterium]